MLTGNAANIAIGLPAIILTARALGPGSYGILALVLTYIQVIKRIGDFQIWQPLIRYGANIDLTVDRDSLLALLKYGFLFDLCCSVGSWLVAIAGALIAERFFGIDGEAARAMIVYATVLLFNANGSSIAVLRLAKRYRTTAYVQLVAGALKVALCGLAFMSNASIPAFVCIWAITDSLAPLLVTRAAVAELRRQGLQSFYRANLHGLFDRFQGLWRFTWSSNFSLTLWSTTQMMDTLLVGWLTDPASAGLYYFAKRIARLGQQAAAQVQAVVYPDITRLWAAARLEAFRRVVMQTEMVVAGFGVLLIVAAAAFGAQVIEWTAGPSFKGAAPLLIVQTIALTLTMSGTVMRSALLAMGRAGSVLKIVTVSTLAFHITAVVLLPIIGPMGANVAQIVLGLIWLGGLAITFRRALSAKVGAGDLAPV